MHFFDRKLALLASVALVLPAVAQAQSKPQDDTQEARSDSSEIVVIGTRKQAASIQFQSSQPISVLSEEDLQHTAVHNVAEALGLLPGVNVLNTGSSFIGGVDGASRGEGMYVGIRGLNSEYNVNLINGVNVAQGQPYSRGVQLSLLPPTGLNTIVLNKSSRADMDGDAIGGTVDFRTPTAFDYSDALHGSLTASGRVESRARTYGDSGLGGGVAGALSTRFGADHAFGIYASGYFDRRTYTNSEIRGAQSAHDDGSWGYANADAKGNNYPGLDPQRNAELTGFDAGVSSGATKRFGGNASLDWHPEDGTKLYLRGTYGKAMTTQDSTLAQYNGGTKAWLQSPGTDRYILTSPSVSVRNYFETNPETSILATAAFGGETQVGGWKVAPELFYSEGHNNRPNHIEVSARSNQSDKYTNGSKIPLGGQQVGYSDNYPVALLNPAIFNAFDNSANVLPARRAGQLTEQFSGQRKWGGRLDISRDLSDQGGIVQSVAFGGKFQTSTRNVSSRDWTTDYAANYVGQPVTWAQLGLTNGKYAQTYPGLYNWSLPRFNKQALFNLFYKYQFANEADGSSYNSFDTCGSLYTNNYNCGTLKGRETVSAGYATTTLKTGDVEIIPGIRYEHTDIRNTYWVIPYTSGAEQPGAFASNKSSFDALLPSLFVNWRPSSAVVVRGDIWQSYTRPPFFQLGGSSTARTGDDGKTTIVQGNPNLKAIRATNVDGSVEWNFAPSGYVMFGGYYKRIRNYMYDSGTSLLNTPTNDGTNQTFISQPRNGGDGNIYGLEFQVQKTFVELPGLLSGFGVGANLTRQWTKVDIGGGIERQIQNAPSVIGQGRVFYALHGFSIDAIYNYTGAYLESYNYLSQPTRWDDRWVRPIQRVDLHVGYEIRKGLKADVSVSNLFNNYTYWAHVGRDSLAISDIVNSGTTTLGTLKYSF